MTGREQYWRIRDHTTVATLYGADQPDAQTVVLVHAALLDRRMWASFATALLGALESGGTPPPYRVLSYDLRGHGAASGEAPITGVGQLAQDLAAVLDETGVGAAHVCGLSLGGAVAQQFALDHPYRLRSLTLVATDLGFPADVMEDRAGSFTPADRDESIDTTLRRWFSAETLAQPSPAVHYARECLRATSPQHWAATWRALGGFDIGDRVDTVAVPVLAVSGAQDTATPPMRLEAVARAYGDARHITIDPGPHLLSLEHGDVLAAHVARFLQEIGREGNTT